MCCQDGQMIVADQAGCFDQIWVLHTWLAWGFQVNFMRKAVLQTQFDNGAHFDVDWFLKTHQHVQEH
jgi:hypothetical protein